MEEQFVAVVLVWSYQLGNQQEVMVAVVDLEEGVHEEEKIVAMNVEIEVKRICF